MADLPVHHPLDFDESYHLDLGYNPQNKQLSVHITGPVGTTGRVEHHIMDGMLALKVNGAPITLEKIENHSYRATLNRVPNTGFDLDILLSNEEQNAGQKFGHVHFGPEGSSSGHTIDQQLTVFETRMLGYPKRYGLVPYDRTFTEKPHENIRTDLHTHSSAQISAEGLMKVAQDNHILYPTALLGELGIDCSKYTKTYTKHFYFPPTDAGKQVPEMELGVLVKDLHPEDRARLLVAFAIPPDRQKTFGNVEKTVYQFRYPISKHPNAAKAIWYKVAEEYKKQGITYAEISAFSKSFLTPENLAFLHEELPKIEAATGVKLRFLVGIPRNLSHEELDCEIEKIKLMGASPYIVGVDFMGFENNKITEMEPYIAKIAHWALHNDPEFTLRIHAGENRKNLDNVKDSLKLAYRYGMRVRIGHAAHGLDKEAIDLASKLPKGSVMIEFNPDSNMALNNIDRAEELKLIECINAGIACVICSDGGGLYQTDANQLWHAANFAASYASQMPVDLSAIAKSEAAHMALEEERFLRKTSELKPDFIKNLAAAYKALPSPSPSKNDPNTSDDFTALLHAQGIHKSEKDVNTATQGKAPLMIVGASSSDTWNDISEPQKKEIRRAINAMVKKLDPQRMYFMIGRPKDEGINKEIAAAVVKHNRTHPLQENFALISTPVEAQRASTSLAPGITHMIPLEGTMFDVPDRLVEEVQKRNGHMIFIGGGSFTRDAILLANENNASYGMMVGPEGASTDKAVMLEQEHSFSGADGLIEHLHSVHKNWFKPTRAHAAASK